MENIKDKIKEIEKCREKDIELIYEKYNILIEDVQDKCNHDYKETCKMNMHDDVYITWKRCIEAAEKYIKRYESEIKEIDEENGEIAKLYEKVSAM